MTLVQTEQGDFLVFNRNRSQGYGCPAKGNTINRLAISNPCVPHPVLRSDNPAPNTYREHKPMHPDRAFLRHKGVRVV